MIYLFNKTATPWSYSVTNGYCARLSSNRKNNKTKKDEYIGISLSKNLIINENIEDCTNMISECAILSDEPTTLDFRYKDLNPWINKLSHPEDQYNVDIFLASIPLDRGIITNITDANILGYRAVNNEFFVYFFAKRNKENINETPVFTVANVATNTEIDYSFIANEDHSGYYVIEDKYTSNPEKPATPMKIRRYRPRRATKLIFVKEFDYNFFMHNYSDKFKGNIIVPFTDENLNELINEYAKKQDYKAATFFTNANRGIDIPTDIGYAAEIIKNFQYVNAVLHSGYATIVK